MGRINLANPPPPACRKILPKFSHFPTFDAISIFCRVLTSAVKKKSKQPDYQQLKKSIYVKLRRSVYVKLLRKFVKKVSNFT